MMMCENFVSYCQKAIDEADAVESIRIGEELEIRAEELKEKQIPKFHKLPDIQFHPSDLDVATHLNKIFGNIRGEYENLTLPGPKNSTTYYCQWGKITPTRVNRYNFA